MSIPFQALKRINPQNLNQTPKYYAQLLSSGTVDLDQIAALMSDGSTVRQNDIYAVLIGMVNEISKQLSQGKIVCIDHLGTFRLSARSQAATTAAEVKPSLIKKSVILYKPSKRLNTTLKSLKYKKLK